MFQYVIYFGALVATIASTDVIKFPLTQASVPEMPVGRSSLTNRAFEQIHLLPVRIGGESRLLTLNTLYGAVSTPSATCRTSAQHDYTTHVLALAPRGLVVEPALCCNDTITIGDYELEDQEFLDFPFNQYAFLPGSHGALGLAFGAASPHKTRDGAVHTSTTVVEHISRKYGWKPIFSYSAPRNSSNGKLFFGESKREYYKGEMAYTPVARHPRSQNYTLWYLNSTSFKLDDQETLPNSSWTLAVVAIEQANINLPPTQVKTFEDIANIKIARVTLTPCSRVDELPTLSIAFGDIVFSLESKYYTEEFEGENCIVKIGRALSDIVLGAPFLEKYFMEFDMEKRRIGVAEQS